MAKGRAQYQKPDQPTPDYEDRILQVMPSRGPQPNLSFFAFTATPKAKTVEVFGRPGSVRRRLELRREPASEDGG